MKLLKRGPSQTAPRTKLIFVLAITLFCSSFAGVPDVHACGGWWDPCCPWWDKSSWDISCYPLEERPQPEPQCTWWDPCWKLRPLPQVIAAEKKAAAGVAAAEYDARAAGADAFRDYWCQLNFFVCGWMTQLGAISRLYAESNRLIQRDPFDPKYLQPFDAVPVDQIDPATLGLQYLPDDDPLALYVNWFTINAIEFWAQADMVRITADRAASCLLLESDGEQVNCSWWQLERLYWGLQRMVDLEFYMGTQIAVTLRDLLNGQGLYDEARLADDIAFTGQVSAWALSQ